jgi:cysteine-S-conjugate beta-lyase
MFDDLSLPALHQRTSAKWSVFPPDVLPAWVAEMDFPLAPPVKAALHDAIERDDIGYPREGDLPLAFAEFALRHWGWSVDPSRVWMVPDVMIGIGEVLRQLSPLDAPIVINSPVYPPFFGVPVEVGRQTLDVPLIRHVDGWQLDLEGLERAFAGGAKTYLLCNPHNPVGRAFTRMELDAIAALAARYGVLVVSDEIHAPLVLPGATHIPFAPVAEAHGAEAVVVTSHSKTFNVAGLKCALVISASPRLRSIPNEVRYRSGILGVVSGIAAFRHGDAWRKTLIAHLDRQRHFLAELLAEHLPLVRYDLPEASYLAWLDCTALGLGPDPNLVFLEAGRVGVNRGRDFGAIGSGFVRVNFGTSAAILTEIVERMARAVRTR